MVPPDSHGIPRAPCYSGTTIGRPRTFVDRAITFSGGPFQNLRLARGFLTPGQAGRPDTHRPTTPPLQRLPASTQKRFSLIRFRSPLLTESRLLSLPVGNEMFHFPTFPPHALYIQAWVTGHDSCRVSPFGNPRITARLAAPRGLSQPPTSFIGSWCQGIHRAPLLTWPQRCSRPLCSSQGTGGPGRLDRRVRPAPGCGPPFGGRRAEGAPLPQDPTACLRPPEPRPHVPYLLRRPYWRGDSRRGRTGQRSTHEHHAGMHIRQWVWTASRPPAAP